MKIVMKYSEKITIKLRRSKTEFVTVNKHLSIIFIKISFLIKTQTACFSIPRLGNIIATILLDRNLFQNSFYFGFKLYRSG